MPESSHPRSTPHVPLTPTGRRALAATMIGTANRAAWPTDATLLVEAVDLVSGALMALAGVSPDEARAVLAALWASDGEGLTEWAGGDR